MWVKTALVLAGLLGAPGAWAQGSGETGGPATTSPPGAPATSSPSAATVPPSPGQRPTSPGAPANAPARAAASGQSTGPAPNLRQQELERRSREIDRRVMRSICSGC